MAALVYIIYENVGQKINFAKWKGNKDTCLIWLSI